MSPTPPSRGRWVPHEDGLRLPPTCSLGYIDVDGEITSTKRWNERPMEAEQSS